MTLPTPALHLITSRRRLAPAARTLRSELTALESLVDDAVEAGVDFVQVRERDLESGILLAFLLRVQARAQRSATRLLLSERADVAAAAGIAGVHLPSTGVSAQRLREIEPGWVLGRSIHTGDQPPDRTACDYLLFGTVFASESKAEGSPVAGLEELRVAAAASRRPVIALGGVTPARVSECLRAGAAGVAAIGAFLPPACARDGLGVREAAAAFRRELGRWRAPGS